MSGRFPAHRAHACAGQGACRHLVPGGAPGQAPRSKSWCDFPETGPVFCSQRIELTDETGHVTRAAFECCLRGDHVLFDTPMFAGRS
jgi:hypothetical protein